MIYTKYDSLIEVICFADYFVMLNRVAINVYLLDTLYIQMVMITFRYSFICLEGQETLAVAHTYTQHTHTHAFNVYLNIL